MSITGQTLLVGLSKYIGDYFTGATTGAGSTTTIVDTSLTRFRDDALIERFFRITETGHSAIWEVRRCSDFVQSTGTATVSPAYGATTGTSMDYEMHRWEPKDKFFALDEAKNRVFPDVNILRTIDTLTGDGHTRVFDIPSTIRSGPIFAQVETPLSADVDWNFLAGERGETTDGYTATDATITTYDRTDADREVPAVEDTCVKFSVATGVNGQIAQTVSSMANGITAASAAGRRMTFARKVYCRTASRVSLMIIDDTGIVATSAFHGGNGWELLTVEGTISTTNATTLTVRLDVSNTTGAVTGFWERGWFYFGTAERVRDGHYLDSQRKRVMRDDTTQQVYLDEVPPRGYQIRLIGYDSLSALGTTAASQVTATMEIDEEQAPILYAAAAEILYKGAGYATGQFNGAALGTARADRIDTRNTWGSQRMSSKLRGPWSR